MTTGLSEAQARPSAPGTACVPGASTADVLRLLSTGATGEILMALGEGPLRTKNLTERVPDYTPRTIYRHAGKLTELDVIEREEEPGVPSKVVHHLTDPCGTELYALLSRFAAASLTRLAHERIDSHAWASLGLLADLWETGMIEELSCEPRSSSELAGRARGLSYHQVNRRASLFTMAGLLVETEVPGRRRCYELTRRARRKMALIAGLARWRHRHVVAEGEEGMTAAEMATLLRTALPLARVPEHAGKRFELTVLGEGDSADLEGGAVLAEVEDDGTIHSCVEGGSSTNDWGGGRVAAWIPALLDGRSEKVLVGEDGGLVADCLGALYEALWRLEPF